MGVHRYKDICSFAFNYFPKMKSSFGFYYYGSFDLTCSICVSNRVNRNDGEVKSGGYVVDQCCLQTDSSSMPAENWQAGK